jgi:hypothetical protein
MMLVLVALAFGGPLAAHETLFGNSPRTIWKGGFEFEWEVTYDHFRKYMTGDKNAGNPTGTRLHRFHFGPNFTYGVTTDFSLFAAMPLAYAERTDPINGRESYMGLDDWEVGMKYRIHNDPFPGGSFQVGLFTDFRLPTGKTRNMAVSKAARPISFGEKGVGVTFGITASLSSLREYIWADFSVETALNEGDTADGPAAMLHLAYAYRFWDLVEYDEIDLIALVEFDLAGRDKGMLNGVRNPDSGYMATHLGLGFQLNITNRHELKMGYNIPLYRNYNGTQFVHDGEFKITYSYLFRGPGARGSN